LTTRFGPSAAAASVAGFADPAWDPIVDAALLVALNARVAECADRLEGNLFYHHDSRPPLPATPDPSRRHKRRNFALYATTGDTLLEIGFNAGHSALLALCANPALRYTAIDLCRHAYTRPCFAILRDAFGERAVLLEGDSRALLPALVAARRRFALCHIDGGHGLDVARADVAHVLDLCDRGQVVLMDDVHNPTLDALVDWHCARGDVARVTMGRAWQGDEQALLRVLRPGAAWR